MGTASRRGYHYGVSGSAEEFLRISDTEREAAVAALGEHMSAGRLNVDEYGERSAQVTTAKTRGDVSAQFSDLPRPHPNFGNAERPDPAAKPARAPSRRGSANATMLAVIAVAIIGFAALMVFTGGKGWFVAIPLIILISNRGKRHGCQNKQRAHERAARHHERMAQRYYDPDG